MAASDQATERAWEDEEGRPNSQVTRFQRIPPTRPAKKMVSIGTPVKPGTGAAVRALNSDDLVAHGQGHLDLTNAPTRFNIADKATATFGFSAPVATEVAIAFAGVVKTVGEVEGQCRDDHDDQDEQRFGHL